MLIYYKPADRLCDLYDMLLLICPGDKTEHYKSEAGGRLETDMYEVHSSSQVSNFNESDFFLEAWLYMGFFLLELKTLNPSDLQVLLP